MQQIISTLTVQRVKEMAEPDARKRALRRFAVFSVGWEAVVLASAAGYMLWSGGLGARPIALLPGLAAVAGTLIPLQLAAMTILRMARR